jgi:quinoprotein glucose dehydrogenase
LLAIFRIQVHETPRLFTIKSNATMFRFFLLPILITPLFAATRVFQAFEGDGFDDWQAEGSAFGVAPVVGRIDGMPKPFTAYAAESLAASSHGGELATGSLTSPEFTIEERYITFLIAGTDQTGAASAQLIVDGKVMREAFGKNSLRCQTVLWDVSNLKGQLAKIRLRDDDTDQPAWIAADHVIFSEDPNQKFPASTRAGKPFTDGLIPTDVIAGASIPIDSTLSIEATFKDQQVTSPTAITFDEQGRIYVAETHRFRQGVEDDRDNLYWFLDDLAAKTTQDRRALHEKWKEKHSIESLTKKSEVIRRLADTDGDGRLDESKVFAGDFHDVLDGTAAGVFFYEGSLYFACIPKIHMLRDTNNDGTADERKVVEEGFGVRVSLSGHDMNGFTLGPDGRIYGTIGDRGMSLITKEGRSYNYPNEGAAFRFEPDGTSFELFHTGLRNPKEIAFDALGNAISVDNNSDQGDAARVVYLVEGGDSGWQMEHQAMHTFHRQIGLGTRPPSRWMDERMWELENPAQPAFMLPPVAHLTSGPSGLSYHPGAGFLESEAGRFLICDYRGGASNSGIWSFEMKPKGASMEISDSRQFAWGIAATDVEYSWDGRVFISDFITGWVSHQAGRLVSLSAGEKLWKAADSRSTPNLIKAGFEHRSSAELANLLKHPDYRVRLRAQIALTRKPDALTHLSAAADSSTFSARVHGIWGLGIIARRGSSPLPYAEFGNVPVASVQKSASAKLASLLEDKNPEIICQALRSLAESPDRSTTLPIARLLLDKSPRVRFFAAMLVGKQKLIEYYGPVCDLLADHDNRDVYLRHAGIFALQHISPDPSVLTALTTHDSPAVRLAAVVALRRMKDPGVADFLYDADSKVVDEAIRAIVDLDMIAQRPQVAEMLDRLVSRPWTDFMLRRLIHNAYRIGTLENAERVLKVAADPKTPALVSKEALRLLSQWTTPFPADQLTGHWRPLEKRPPESIRPALIAAMPALLQQKGPVLTAALRWISQYQLDIAQLDSDTLARLIGNLELPSTARASAIDLLIRQNPSTLAATLNQFAMDASDDVALAALSGLAKAFPEKALTLLKQTLDSKKVPRTQKCWEILATLSGPAVDALFIEKIDQLRASQGVSPSAIELISSAGKRSSPAVGTALAQLRESLATSSDPLAQWNSALEGGDPAAGASLFESHPAGQCMRCHRAEEGHAAGGETAPNLAGVAKRHPDRRYFLESMVLPSKFIAEGFGSVSIDFKNGASLSGNLLAETPEHLDLDAAGKVFRIQRSDITSLTPPVSPMPPMAGLLSPSELRDMVAWLASLDQDSGPSKPPIQPMPLDPATLEVLEKTAAVVEQATADPALLKLGKQQFIVCGACHGQSGEGTAAGPPLAGSEWVNGPEENLIRIQLRGLVGPIRVKGQEYNIPGGMAALAFQTDEQIAAVLTYMRSSFGNSAPPISPAAVAALRKEVGKPQLTAKELIPPRAAKK